MSYNNKIVIVRHFLCFCLENVKKCILLLFRIESYSVIVEANRQAVSFINVKYLWY